MVWRLLIGITAVGALPFLRPDWHYVQRQYALCFEKLRVAANPWERFNDLGGIFSSLGLHPPMPAMMAARALAAVSFLLLAWWAVRRAANSTEGMLRLLALAASYLMLFNPKTESNSYVILAPAIAAYAARAALLRRSRGEVWFLASLAVALGSENLPKPIFHATNYWLKPLTALVFLGWLLWQFRRGGLVRKASGGPFSESMAEPAASAPNNRSIDCPQHV